MFNEGEQLLTTEIVVTLGARCSERIGVLDEAIPIRRIVLLRLIRREPIPNTGVDLQHLRLLDDLNLRGHWWRDMPGNLPVLIHWRLQKRRVATIRNDDIRNMGRLCAVSCCYEWPCSVGCTTASRGPYLEPGN